MSVCLYEEEEEVENKKLEAENKKQQKEAGLESLDWLEDDVVTERLTVDQLHRIFGLNSSAT